MSLEVTYHANARNENMNGKPLTSETVTASATSAQSAVTPGNADYIRIHSTADNRYAYGANPTATATAGDNGHFLASGATIEIPATAGHKLAVITAS